MKNHLGTNLPTHISPGWRLILNATTSTIWITGLALAQEGPMEAQTSGAVMFTAGSLGWVAVRLALWIADKRKTSTTEKSVFQNYRTGLIASLVATNMTIMIAAAMGLAPNNETALTLACIATLAGLYAIWSITKSTLQLDRHLRNNPITD